MTNKPHWDEYFMDIAIVVSRRSPDPKYKVGAVIVAPGHRIISTGYNGFPAGFDESKIDWNGNREDATKYIVHAEANALLYTNNHDLRGSQLYVTISPCNQCIKLLAAAGIKEVIYAVDYKKHHDFTVKYCHDMNIILRCVNI